jgi:glycosyltransferase involved in cell wall biosynthesis
MRIAIDLTALLPESTGVDNYLTELVLHLAKIDLENQYRIFINYEDRGVFPCKLPSNFELVSMCLRPRPVRLFFQQVLLPMAAKAWKADIIHSPSFILPFFQGSQSHVLTVHDLTFFSLPDCHTALHRSAPYKYAIHKSILKAHLVIVPSEFTKQQILDIMPGVSPQQIRVTPLGISNEFRHYPESDVKREVSRLNIPHPYILYVGTIEPRKNLQFLVESYCRLIEKDDIPEHLVLAGRLGWDYEGLIKQIMAPELRERVHLIGYVSQRDLPWIYAGARLFVYPSLQEGFGFPPLEAMACGIPTISSLSSSLSENLRDAAELVPPDNVKLMTTAIRRMLREEPLRQERREAGLKCAARYQWENTARHTLECYKELC